MKEATGELNMTVIVIVAIAAVAAIFYVFVWPVIQGNLTANARCSGAYGCGDCTDEGTMTCEGYYEEDGTLEETEIQCSCEPDPT